MIKTIDREIEFNEQETLLRLPNDDNEKNMRSILLDIAKTKRITSSVTDFVEADKAFRKHNNITEEPIFIDWLKKNAMCMNDYKKFIEQNAIIKNLQLLSE